MFPVRMALLIVGWFLVAQTLALPVPVGLHSHYPLVTLATTPWKLDSRQEIPSLRAVYTSSSTSSSTSTAISTPTKRPIPTSTKWFALHTVLYQKRDCSSNGGSGGNGGNATGPNSHGGDGGDGGNGGTCNETGGTSNLSSGVVAGIVIGALAGICTIIGGGYKFLKWAKKNPQHKAST